MAYTENDINQVADKSAEAIGGLTSKGIGTAVGGPIGTAIGAALDSTGISKILGYFIIGSVLFMFLISSILVTNTANIGFNAITHIDTILNPVSADDKLLGKEAVLEEDLKYSRIIGRYMEENYSDAYTTIEGVCKKNGIDYEKTAENIVDNTFTFSNAESEETNVQESVVTWATETLSSKKFAASADKQCPICHPNKSSGWNNLGFVLASYTHGGNLYTECRNADVSELTLSKFKDLAGSEWEKISAQNLTASDLNQGDVLLLYKSGSYQDVALYIGHKQAIFNMEIVDLSELKKDYTIPKAFRFTNQTSKSDIAKTAQKYINDEAAYNEAAYKTSGQRLQYGDFVTVVVRNAYDPNFMALDFSYAEDNFETWDTVQSEDFDEELLEAGDIIQYKVKGGGQACVIYLGQNKYAEERKLVKNRKFSDAKKSTIQVLRACTDTNSIYASRDVAIILNAFSVYEAQLIPADDSANSTTEAWIEQKNTGSTNRDLNPTQTLKSMIKGRMLYEITYGDLKTENGKTYYSLIEINPPSGEHAAEIFNMDPNGEYTTEASESQGTRKSGDTITIGETTIANAIESNTDTYLELLYDSLDGIAPTMAEGTISLPIKSLFSTIKLSKKFSDDKKGIECTGVNNYKVYLCERGLVKEVGSDYIKVEGNYTITYKGLKTIDVKKGDLIARGKVIGTASNTFRLEVQKDGEYIDPEPLMSYGGRRGGNETIAVAGASIAWETRAQSLGNNGTKLYRSVHDKVTSNDRIYASCDRTVCVAVRWSGADDNYPLGPVSSQYNYLNGAGKTKWKKVTGLSGKNCLKPGDVLIRNGVHTLLYLGNEAVKKVYKNSNGNFVEGSYQDKSPGLRSYTYQGNGTTVTVCGNKYEVYRNIRQETNSKYKNIKP